MENEQEPLHHHIYFFVILWNLSTYSHHLLTGFENLLQDLDLCLHLAWLHLFSVLLPYNMMWLLDLLYLMWLLNHLYWDANCCAHTSSNMLEFSEGRDNYCWLHSNWTSSSWLAPSITISSCSFPFNFIANIGVRSEIGPWISAVNIWQHFDLDSKSLNTQLQEKKCYLILRLCNQ